MSILTDVYIEEIVRKGLIAEPDYSLINPASIDVRVGSSALIEEGRDDWRKVEIPTDGLVVWPGMFLLVHTQEHFKVPNGYAVDLRLKSSTARRGWDHSLAFWVDPGWDGVLTMEIRNVLRYSPLMLVPGMRFAQAIVHKLVGMSARPYEGRYQGARTVEAAKV